MKVYAEHYFIREGVTPYKINQLWADHIKHHPGSKRCYIPCCRIFNKKGRTLLLDFIIRYQQPSEMGQMTKQEHLTVHVLTNFAYADKRLYLLKDKKYND